MCCSALAAAQSDPWGARWMSWCGPHLGRGMMEQVCSSLTSGRCSPQTRLPGRLPIPLRPLRGIKTFWAPKRLQAPRVLPKSGPGPQAANPGPGRDPLPLASCHPPARTGHCLCLERGLQAFLGDRHGPESRGRGGGKERERRNNNEGFLITRQLRCQRNSRFLLGKLGEELSSQERESEGLGVGRSVLLTPAPQAVR